MNPYLEQMLSSELFMHMMNSVSECVYICDEEGVIRFVNHATEKLEGESAEQILGRHIKHRYPADTSPMLKNLRTEKPIYDVEYVYMIKGKEIRQIFNCIPMHHEGRLIGSFAAGHDVTYFREILDDNIRRQKLEHGADNAEGGKRFESLIGQDPEFLECIRIAKNAAKSESSVLLSGFTGSGKEIFAGSIHNESVRKDRPFLAINCAAIPEALLESLLFGTKKGSFTGSIDKIGIFQQADGGTLFLDEINSMPLHSQAKLLRAIEEKAVRPIGGDTDIPVDVRIISSINTTPAQAIRNNRLREDLFYRLSVVSVMIPPISERKGDIALLTEHFIEMFNRRYYKNIRGLAPDCRRFFMEYGWPGNVRQLKHTIEAAVNMADVSAAQITMADLPKYLLEQMESEASFGGAFSGMSSGGLTGGAAQGSASSVFADINATEKETITNALIQSGGNVSKAARLLDMNRQTLVYRMKKHGIKR